MRRTNQNTLDPVFNSISVKRIKSSNNAQAIEIMDNILISKPSILSVTQLKFIQENTNTTSFLLDIDEENPQTLIIKRATSDGTIIDRGILYDTNFNKPSEDVLFISPLFDISESSIDAEDYLANNLKYILRVTSTTENCILNLPTLSIFGQDDYRQIRISCDSEYPIFVYYEGSPFLQIYKERVSFLWCKITSRYTWHYIP